MTAFCGISDASGNPIKPNIMMNGSLHEDFQNIVNNRDTYYMYYYRLLEIAMSVFEWKNLPEGVDERQLEWWLLVNGYCLFFYDEDLKTGKDKLNAPEGYAVLQCTLSGQWNMYMLPTWRHAYSVDGINVDLDESNSVIVFNNYLRTSMVLTLRQYAWRLANADRTMDVNIANQKTTKIIPVDDRTRLTLKNLNMKIYGNDVYAVVDKNLDLSDLQPIDLTVPYVANDLQTYKHQIWNEALTYLGVENVNTEKKERLISDEVFSNMGDVEAQRFARLNARKKAAREINELFGLDVDVDFRSGIYIHADGYGAQEIPTTGMQDSSVISEDGGYGSNDSGILANIKRLLGMGA